MYRRSMTLIELLIAIVILSVLSTLAVTSYSAVIEDSKQKVCETNLKALKAALDIYAMENDIMPGDLGQLPEGYIRRGYAKVMGGTNGILVRLALFVSGLEGKDYAHAQIFMREHLAKGNFNIMTCPSDKTPPTAAQPAQVSYGLNAMLAGRSTSLLKTTSGNTVFIIDSEAATFYSLDQAAPRHTRIFRTCPFFKFITADGRIINYTINDVNKEPGGTSEYPVYPKEDTTLPVSAPPQSG